MAEPNLSQYLTTDPNVQRVRDWFQAQPFELRILTLILFLTESVKNEFGEEIMEKFDSDLKEVYRKLPCAKRQN